MWLPTHLLGSVHHMALKALYYGGPSYGIANENVCGHDLYQLLAMQEMSLPSPHNIFQSKTTTQLGNIHTSWRSFRTNKPFQMTTFL